MNIAAVPIDRHEFHVRVTEALYLDLPAMDCISNRHNGMDFEALSAENPATAYTLLGACAGAAFGRATFDDEVVYAPTHSLTSLGYASPYIPGVELEKPVDVTVSVMRGARYRDVMRSLKGKHVRPAKVIQFVVEPHFFL